MILMSVGAIILGYILFKYGLGFMIGGGTSLLASLGLKGKEENNQ